MWCKIWPWKPGNGGVLAMPMRKNIPWADREDWSLTTCPVCGAECWSTALARYAQTMDPGLRAACTECALRAGLNSGSGLKMGVDLAAGPDSTVMMRPADGRDH